MERSEVKPRRRQECDEATHQRRGGESEGGALLRRVLVAAVWNVWVGLWEMRGNGERIAVTEPNGVTSSENRVLVGTLVVP